MKERADDHPDDLEERWRVAHVHAPYSYGQRSLDAIQNHLVELLVQLFDKAVLNRFAGRTQTCLVIVVLASLKL